MTLLLAALFVIGVTVLVLGIAKASYARSERADARRRNRP